MSGSTPFFDVTAAGSLAASVCAREARDRAPDAAPPPFAAAPSAPCPLACVAARRLPVWRRIAGALFDLVSGPRL